MWGPWAGAGRQGKQRLGSTPVDDVRPVPAEAERALEGAGWRLRLGLVGRGRGPFVARSQETVAAGLVARCARKATGSVAKRSAPATTVGKERWPPTFSIMRSLNRLRWTWAPQTGARPPGHPRSLVPEARPVNVNPAGLSPSPARLDATLEFRSPISAPLHRASYDRDGSTRPYKIHCDTPGYEICGVFAESHNV